MKLGFDVDGVLADFNTAYIRNFIRVTGEDKFGPPPIAIPMWNYPQEHYGYTDEQAAAVLADIRADETFWEGLQPYPSTKAAIYAITQLPSYHDVYFITDRKGVRAKAQTERWLEAQGISRPTVLLSAEKGLVAVGLGLDLYIDDKPSNCQAVREVVPDCKVFLYNQSWNAKTLRTFNRVNTIEEALSYVN